jgi:hypothetical protein
MAAPVVESWLARSLPAAFRTMVTETLQATSLREDIETFQLPGGVFVVFAVSPLSVADGEAESQQHDADGRREHDKNGAVERPLCFLGRSLRSRIAHGAALGERRR